MNGVLVLDKPAGFTSFDAVAVLRKLTGERKIGHTGTLDPMATGVLPMLLGKAAKAVDLLPDTDKEYRAEFTLGRRFDTGDSTGRVLEERDVAVSRAQLEAALGKFRGEIDQVPPMVSAVSIGGKRLYEYARQGVEVPRKPRKVQIFRLELAHYDEAARAGTLLVRCSKGTYIRTLIEDIAGEMGALGAMTALRRTAACGFTEADACPLETLRARPEEIPARLRPTESLFADYPPVRVSAAQAARFQNGGSLALERLHLPHMPADGQRLRIQSPEGEFLGLGQVELAAGQVKFLKLFKEAEP